MRRAAASRLAGLVFAGAALASCEGVGIVATDNPYTKLSQAVTLREDCRLMQARQQIEQAIPLLEKTGDRHGLAEAYRQYAFLARAGGANADPVVLCKPVPGAERFDRRPEALDRSDGYFNKALELATESGDSHLRSNLLLNLSRNQSARGNRPEACSYLDRALDADREANLKQPGVTVQLPPGVSSLTEGVRTFQTKLDCPSS